MFMSRTPGRSRLIWQQVAAIPRGMVASYGQIAQLAGMPRGARLVGPAMGLAPDSLQLPWHRVVNAQGRVSIPCQSPAYQLQIDRLMDEGVVVVDGCVDMERYAWRPSLDELVWGPGAWRDDLPAAGSKNE